MADAYAQRIIFPPCWQKGCDRPATFEVYDPNGAVFQSRVLGKFCGIHAGQLVHALNHGTEPEAS